MRARRSAVDTEVRSQGRGCKAERMVSSSRPVFQAMNKGRELGTDREVWESMMDYHDNDDTASQLPDRLLTLQETEHMHHVVVLFSLAMAGYVRHVVK